MWKETQHYCNRNEQYSRKYSIRIIGLKEDQDENTKEIVTQVIKESANINIRDTDIVNTHWLPTKQANHNSIFQSEHKKGYHAI